MKTNLNNRTLSSHDAQLADTILRSCVHCGFCNATCPTYQIRGDELDGPRGRIYLIKQMLEGKTPGKETQLHLDRCLTCRNCESTCPSGVQYSQLLNIGRSVLNKEVTRSYFQRLQHYGLRKLFLSKFLFSFLLASGQFFKPVLPAVLKASIPDRQKKITFQHRIHNRKILLVPGCVQSDLKPNIDIAARIVFDKLQIECVDPVAPSCCGSLSHHLNAEEEAMQIIKSNIDNWWPLIESKTIEAICMTASGCGVAIKEYEQLLADDEQYSKKARVISDLYKDPAEIVSQVAKDNGQAGLTQLLSSKPEKNITFHPPCTLQHGMRLNNLVEPILEACGYSLQTFDDRHLCCGSAGTYSITQKKLSQQLLNNKLRSIEKTSPDIIVTANIGCQLHLQSGTITPVKHWLELLV
jgi:glycolate oxidase iron-sulfur subunit